MLYADRGYSVVMSSYDKLIYDNLVYIMSKGRGKGDLLSDVFPINFSAAKSQPLPLGIILSLDFALFLQKIDINIDTGDFNCYNIGEEWRNYTVDGGIRLCLYSFRLKTTDLSRIAR